MSVDVVVFGKVNKKGVLGGVKSKGGIFATPIVGTSSGNYCCCVKCALPKIFFFELF